MTAAELLLDLAERLTEADRKLTALAHECRFDREQHAHLTGKTEMARIALGYVEELQRMAGADV